MKSFQISTQKAKQEVTNLMRIQSALKEMENEIKCFSTLGGSNLWSIRTSIESLRASIENTADTTGKLKECLDDVIALYEKTEQMLLQMEVPSGISQGEEDTNLQEWEEDISRILENIKYGVDEALTYVQGLIPNVFAYFGDPVNMSTGNYIEKADELRVGGFYPICWKRFYNTLGNITTGVLGTGWRHNHEIRIERKGNGYVRYNGQGEATFFVPEGDVFTTVWGNTEILQNTEEGICITNEYETQLFDEKCRIIKVTSKKGNSLQYTYEGDLLVSIENNSGQAFKIFYDAGEERIVEVRASDGKRVRYSYQNGEVISADVNGNIKRYEYDAEGAIIKVVNADNKELLSNTYDNKKRIVEQNYPDGGTMKYSYSEGKTSFYAQNGQKIVFEQDGALRHIKTIYDDGEEVYVYNDRNQRISVTDKMGNTTRFTYDNKGNKTSIIDALGNKTCMTYDENGKMVSVKNAYEAQTTLRYDECGNIIEKKDALGNKTIFGNYVNGKPGMIVLPSKSVIKMEYDHNGNMISKVRDGWLAESFEYDEANQMIAYVDGLGNRTCYEYDEKGRLIKKIAPNGMEQIMEYTGSGKVLSVTDFTGNKTCYQYNSLNKVEAVTDSMGMCTRYEYDIMWNMSGKITGDGTRHTYEYNRLNQLQRTYTDGVETAAFAYDANGNRCSVTTSGKGTVKYVYDPLNRLIQVVNPEGEMMHITYDKVGNVTERIDFNGDVSKFEYDVLGRKVYEEQADGLRLYYSYDEDGHLISKKNQFGKGITWRYFQNGLLESKTLSDGSSVTYEYEKNGLVKKEIYSSGVELNYKRDALNRVTCVYDNCGSSKKYAYDAKGKMTSFIDANGNETKYTYATDGRCLEIVDAMGSRLTYSYDSLGNVIEKVWHGKVSDEWVEKRIQFIRDEKGTLLAKVDALGNKETYSYDEHNRVNHITDALGRELSLAYTEQGDLEELIYNDRKIVSLSYNESRQLIGFTDENGVVSMERDSTNHLTKLINYNGEEIIYTWDEPGRMCHMTYPDGTVVAYEYDELSRLAKVMVNQQEIRYDYDENGRLRAKTYPGDVVSAYAYNVQGRIEKITISKADDLLKECAFVYDACGNKTGVNKKNYLFPNQSVDLKYTYDSLNRISEVFEDGALLRTYEYDGFGNRAALVENGIRTEYHYDANNCLIEQQSFVTPEQDSTKELISSILYSYDSVGNLCNVVEDIKGEKKERKYVYDCQNRVVKAITQEGTSEYKYNGVGQLLESNIRGEKTEYLLDYTKCNRNILGKRDKKGLELFLWDKTLTGSVNNGEMKSVLTDDLGSITNVFDIAGQMEFDMSYDEYGNATNLLERRFDFGYVGLLHENGSGLYHAGQRIYDAAIGRFNTKDPMLGDTKNVQNQNPYAYCFNKPMTLVDLDGCFPSFGEVWNGVTDWADDTWNGVCRTAEDTWNGVCRTAEDTWNGVCRTAEDTWSWINEKAEDGYEYLSNEWNEFCDTATETYHYVRDEIVETYGEIRDSVELIKRLYTDPEFHYARNANNEYITYVSQVCDENGNPTAAGGWTLLPESQSIYHMITDSEQGAEAIYNKKYVKSYPDGSSSEIVICFPPGGEPYIVTDPVNAGTYNYSDSTAGFWGTIGHFIYDVAPYWIHGNQETDSGNEYMLYRLFGAKDIPNLWHDAVVWYDNCIA